MDDNDVTQDIRSVFKPSMRNDHFTYLQPTGGGSKQLTIPSQSRNPQQVAHLSGNSGTIYILACSLH